MRWKVMREVFVQLACYRRQTPDLDPGKMPRKFIDVTLTSCFTAEACSYGGAATLRDIQIDARFRHVRDSPIHNQAQPDVRNI
ncbi:hypothetical protein EMIT0357P_40180 [Pseudomonas marginalis]